MLIRDVPNDYTLVPWRSFKKYTLFRRHDEPREVFLNLHTGALYLRGCGGQPIGDYRTLHDMERFSGTEFCVPARVEVVFNNNNDE